MSRKAKRLSQSTTRAVRSSAAAHAETAPVVGAAETRAGLDREQVRRIAEHDKQLAARAGLRHAESDSARDTEARAIEKLWRDIAEECAAYCAAYNAAFGTIRILSEVHADTVVVRSQPDQQDTVVFHRTHATDTHTGNLAVHRYHYPTHPVDLPVGLRRTPAGAVTLTHLDEEVTPEELVLKVLSAFTEQLALANLNRGTASRSGEGL